MKKQKWMFLLIIVLIIGCEKETNTDQTIELTISAAASLMDSLLEINDNFMIEYPDITISFNFGGSGTLRKQIEQGAPIDLFFSASEKDYNLLKESGFIESGSQLLQNKLAIITSNRGEVNSFEEFLKTDKKMAIGTPETVPVGMYAKQVLQELGAWDLLQERLVYTNSVSQVVNYVEEEATEMGIVYISDVLGSEKVSIIEEVDPNMHSSIVYHIGIIQNGHMQTVEKRQAIATFYQYVQKEKSLEIFHRHGFQIKNIEVGE